MERTGGPPPLPRYSSGVGDDRETQSATVSCSTQLYAYSCTVRSFLRKRRHVFLRRMHMLPHETARKGSVAKDVAMALDGSTGALSRQCDESDERKKEIQPRT